MPSFHDLLQRRLRTDPGQPLVTLYDDDTGERTELSVTTYANWVAKTAGVLVEDLDLDAGDPLRVDLPIHWLGPVFWGAALTVGVELGDAGPEVGPEIGPVVGHRPGCDLFCALLPFAGPSHDPPPTGTLDFGLLWPGQPDAFLGVPDARPLAVEPDGRRLLCVDDAGSPDRLPDGVMDLFLGLLAGGGSLVLVAHADPARLTDRLTAERAEAAHLRTS